MNFLPSIVTLLNLCFGTISLICTINHDYRMAGLCILIAVVMDSLDGRVARKLNVSSELGKELDSLSDLVSFGAAPALMVLTMIPDPDSLMKYGYIILAAICIIYILCGAFRLARFNILNIHDHFVGIPITLAGVLVAIVTLALPHMSMWFYMLMMAVLAYLMVSKITIKKI